MRHFSALYSALYWCCFTIFKQGRVFLNLASRLKWKSEQNNVLNIVALHGEDDK